MRRELILEDPLGQGAVATVHRVRDAATGKVCAGKVLHRSHEQDEAASARFAQEARLLADVKHENLVDVFGFETIDDRQVLLMELVDGPDLATIVATDAPLPPQRVVELALGIARGLAAAHGAGIIHRDLKPSNVLVAGGTVPKIGDFGLARASSIAGVDPRAFAIVGTPDYMAPECLDPLAVDARTDLYALGCMIHEMCTGRPPYGAATPFGVLSEHRSAAIPELPEAYAALRGLFVALVAKSPADRPQSAAAVADMLERLVAGEERALAIGTPLASSRCASCSGPLIPGVGVCLGCGMPTARIEPGPCTLLVTGPGKTGDKLDSQLREALRTWLVDNPDLGLAPAKGLHKTIPRLPFTLVGSISEESGLSLQRSLQRLGLETEVVLGGPLKSAAMRKKVQDLSVRVFLISITMMAGVISQGWMALFGIVAMVGASAGTALWSIRAVASETAGRARALPNPVRAALSRVEKSLPAIAEVRHRQGLRAAVSRATELARALPAGDEGIVDELAQAIDAATVASARLDALDRQLAQLDRDAASEDARALLHERDTWSARLLSLTATLDSLKARIARATARRDRAAEEDALADLRARIEALEEVQSG
jgi:tRNA A-37 threonylcarbamoyl transferase component Bud32